MKTWVNYSIYSERDVLWARHMKNICGYCECRLCHVLWTVTWVGKGHDWRWNRIHRLLVNNDLTVTVISGPVFTDYLNRIFTWNKKQIAFKSFRTRVVREVVRDHAVVAESNVGSPIYIINICFNPVCVIMSWIG